MNRHLHILWTNDNLETSEKMVFMYAINSMKNHWWDEVTIIIWGATAALVAKNSHIQEKIAEAIEKGVTLSSCKACCDQLGVTEKHEELGIEVIYWGEPLTTLLQRNAPLLTI